MPLVMMGVIPSSMRVPRFEARMTRSQISGSVSRARAWAGRVSSFRRSREAREGTYRTSRTIRFHKEGFESRRGR